MDVNVYDCPNLCHSSLVRCAADRSNKQLVGYSRMDSRQGSMIRTFGVLFILTHQAVEQTIRDRSFGALGSYVASL